MIIRITAISALSFLAGYFFALYKFSPEVEQVKSHSELMTNMAYDEYARNRIDALTYEMYFLLSLENLSENPVERELTIQRKREMISGMIPLVKEVLEIINQDELRASAKEAISEAEILVQSRKL